MSNINIQFLNSYSLIWQFVVINQKNINIYIFYFLYFLKKNRMAGRSSSQYCWMVLCLSLRSIDVWDAKVFQVWYFILIIFNSSLFFNTAVKLRIIGTFAFSQSSKQKKLNWRGTSIHNFWLRKTLRK